VDGRGGLIMVTLRAKVPWIVCGHRLAVGETFQVETERHAAGLLARGEAERVADQSPTPQAPAPEPAVAEAPAVPVAPMPRGGRSRKA